MKFSIEKRPMNNEENYFVLSSGEKKIEMPVNAVKATLLLWTFLIAAMATFIIGQQVALTNMEITAYMMQGNVTDMSGNPVDCHPILNDKKVIQWNCVGLNGTNATVKP